jgi:hypothetical protein
MTPNYITAPWYTLLVATCHKRKRHLVAKELGVSAPLISQVLNGSGKYSTGEASTQRLAQRVLHSYAPFECPYLSADAGKQVLIDAQQCRGHAHRAAPVSNPHHMQHWQACHQCEHREWAAPVQPRPLIKRGARAANPLTASQGDLS